jgi:hypothetical protein
MSPNDSFFHPRTWHSLRKLDLQVFFYPHFPGFDFLHDQLLRLLKYRGYSSGSESLEYKTRKGTPYHAYLSILRAAGGEGGYFSHLERRLLFYTGSTGGGGEHPFNDDGSPEIFFGTDNGDPNEMLAELACAFGGSFVVDGAVYIRDRVQVGMLFTEARGGGGWYYLNDVYIQAMAQLSVDCFGGNIKDQIRQYVVGFEPHKALEFADSPRFAGHEEMVRAYKAFIRQMRSTVEITG